MTVGEWIQIQGRQERAEGIAFGVLEVLGTKGNISDALRERISGESNPKVLESWIKIAVTVKTPQEFENQIGAE